MLINIALRWLVLVICHAALAQQQRKSIENRTIAYADNHSSLFTGRFSDWLTIKLARRNKGIMEAEHRLWPFLICLILLPGSLLLWGVGAAHDVHWFGLIVAMFFLSFVNTCGITLSVNYMVDSYRELAGVAITSIILVRNTMSFAIGYG